MAVALSLALAACGGKNTADKKPPLVDTITLQQSDVVNTISAVGSVRHKQEIPVGFSEPGRVTSVRFKEGDKVTRGQLLATLAGIASPVPPVTNSAELEKARARFEQIKTLQAQGYATNKQFAIAEAAVMAAEGRLRPLDPIGEEIYAPAGGTVLSRLVQPGQSVTAGTAALVLGDDSGGYVFRTPVSEQDAAKLKKGMKAKVLIETLGTEPVEATFNEVERSGRGIVASFVMASKTGVQSGQIGTIAIELPEGQGAAFKLPASALFAIGAKDARVYVLEPKSGRLEVRSVTLAGGSEGNAIVTAGLKLGDVVVMPGDKKLKSGLKVRAKAKAVSST